MEGSVTELAINKVHNIVQKIGYPTKSPDIMDPAKLKKFYGTLPVNSSSYFDNAVSMTKFQVRDMWKALGKPVDRDQW
jgi:endothelin-converting enzyme